MARPYYRRPFLFLVLAFASTLSVRVLQEDSRQAFLNIPGLIGLPGLPVVNPTLSFWIDSPGANPLAKEGSDGALSVDADVCIIGSGITGVSAAYHLAKGVEARESGPIMALVLDARDFGSGATGRNGGHLTPVRFN
ncbi:hypothetical protein C0993_002342, partial [Termitomyces sp. T159_Od127]